MPQPLPRVVPGAPTLAPAPVQGAPVVTPGAYTNVGSLTGLERAAATAALQLAQRMNPAVATEIQQYIDSGQTPTDPAVVAAINTQRQHYQLPAISPATSGTGPITGNIGTNMPPGPGTAADPQVQAQPDVPGQPPQNDVFGDYTQFANSTGRYAPTPGQPSTPTTTTPPTGGGDNVAQTTDPATPPAGANAAPGSLAGTPLDPYIGAMRGERDPLQLVVGKVLEGLGIDVNRPGLFTDQIQKGVSDLLPFYMSGATSKDDVRQRATDFQNIMGGQHGYANLANDTMNRLQGIGDLGGIQPADQQDFIMNAIGSLDAGANPLAAQVDAAKMARLNNMWMSANADTPVGYIDFLRQHANEVPQADKLRQLLLNSTPSQNVTPLR